MTSSSVIQVTCSLVSPTNEMIREEILKQAAHVSRSVRKLQFDQDGMTLSFEAPADEATDLRSRVEEFARSIQRALRRLERRVVYRSQVKKQEHYQSPTPPGVVALGPGQVAVSGSR